MGLGDTIRNALTPSESDQNQSTSASAPDEFYDRLDQGDYQGAAALVDQQEIPGHAAEYALDRAEDAGTYLDLASAFEDHSDNMSELASGLVEEHLDGQAEQLSEEAEEVGDAAENAYQEAYQNALKAQSAAGLASTAAEHPGVSMDRETRKTVYLAERKADRAIESVENQAPELDFEE